MATDYTELASASGGDKIAGDTDGTGLWQYVKTAFGADGTQTIVTATVGLPVDILAGTAEIGNVKNSGTFATQSACTNAGTFAVQEDGAALTALQLIDNAVSGAGFNITQFGGASVPLGAGVEATALRVTLATDSTGLVSVDDNGGSLTVDNAQLSVVGAGTEAAAMRVTIANNSTGLLSIDDNGGSLTVDNGGTFATQAVCTNAGTFAVQEDGAALTSLQLIDNAVSGAGFNITQFGGASVPLGAGVEATALRVTLATDSTGLISVDDNGGSLTIDNAQLSVVGGGTEAAAMRVTIANNSTGLLSVDDGGGSLTIDGTVTASTTTGSAAHDAAASGNPVLIGSRATAAVEALTEVAEADASYIATDLQGVVLTRSHITAQEHVQYHVVNTAGTELAVTGLDAGGAGVHNYVTAVMVHNAHASTNGFIQLLDGSGGTVLATFPAPATGGVVIDLTQPLKQTTANTALYWDASAAITTLYVTIIGYQGQG